MCEIVTWDLMKASYVVKSFVDKQKICWDNDMTKMMQWLMNECNSSDLNKINLDRCYACKNFDWSKKCFKSSAEKEKWTSINIQLCNWDAQSTTSFDNQLIL